MLDPVGLSSRPHELEPPDVVAHVRTRDQANLDEVAEIAVDGDAVVARRRKLLGDLAVTEWRSRGLETLEHRDTR